MDETHDFAIANAQNIIDRGEANAPVPPTYPRRPHHGGINDVWIRAQFRGHDDADRLRGILESTLRSQWWDLHLPTPGNDLDAFVNDGKCLFCDTYWIWSRLAFPFCVHKHLDYHPPMLSSRTRGILVLSSAILVVGIFARTYRRR
ncbi:hypothetical protein PIIN_06510 [Serendipita indica DSM 11827]|uniref:Uncharacterized protein n=1 Tax=Serendipita indica (strain DSM 11827) TaxID=1109443 RepID=G4TMN0_SERID|nr:hypothetical protein PIIN_06510 [Serendipita indica DSM 11827]